MGKKEFTARVKNVAARGRGKNNGQGGGRGSSAYVYMPSGGVEAASGGSGHTHSNKAALDSLSTDTDGYVFVTRYAEILNEETGQVEVKLITEKVKAGYADLAELARDLTEDSPALKRFLSRRKDDTAEGRITFERGFQTAGDAEFGAFTPDQKGGMIDPQGNGELESLKLRKSLSVGAPVVAGVSGAGIWIDEFGNTHLQVDFAEVTKRATFAEVEVKKLRHVGGVMILSAASMECSAVVETPNSYVCYFDTTPERYPGRVIANEFRVGDLARSQTCNLIEGTTRAAANRYYWRRVVAVGLDFIELSKTDCDPAGVNDAPAPGDSIIQMGNAIDPQRQSLVIIAAYGANSPYIYQFQGINDYSLPDSKAKTRISPYGNRFSGEFIVETSAKNQSIGDYITDLTGVFRLVAEVDNLPLERDEQGRVTALSISALCRAYRIEGGDMMQLTFDSKSPQSFGFLASGATLLSLGGSLLTLGSGEVPELLTLTYTVFRQKLGAQELEVHPDYLSRLYDGVTPIEIQPDFAKVIFTLWRNGEKVAETAVEGAAQMNLTTTRFSVLNDRITGEVTRLDGAVSTVEQTADQISMRVHSIEGVVNLLPADGVWKDYPSEKRWYIHADSSFFDNATNRGTLKGHRLRTPTVALQKGKKYTISFRVGQVHNGATATLQGYRGIGKETLSIFFTGKEATPGLNAFTFEPTTDSDHYFELSVDGPEDESFITFSRIMLEEGESASPYVMDSSGLLPTGIDIRRRRITLRADNVEILNNAGNPTASFDSAGEFCAHRVVALDPDGNKVASMNSEGTGEYIMYYPDGGKRMQLSPTADKDSALIYYDPDGSILWTLGAGGFSWQVQQRFVPVAGFALAAGNMDPSSNAIFAESNLFKFVANESSPNYEFNGLYYVKNTGENLNQEKASGLYYAVSPESDYADTLKRRCLKFEEGIIVKDYYVNIN